MQTKTIIAIALICLICFAAVYTIAIKDYVLNTDRWKQTSKCIFNGRPCTDYYFDKQNKPIVSFKQDG